MRLKLSLRQVEILNEALGTNADALDCSLDEWGELMALLDDAQERRTAAPCWPWHDWRRADGTRARWRAIPPEWHHPVRCRRCGAFFPCPPMGNIGNGWPRRFQVRHGDRSYGTYSTLAEAKAKLDESLRKSSSNG